MPTPHSSRFPENDPVGLLLSLYRRGYFAMASGPAGDIRFYTADPRGVLPLCETAGLHIPRRLARRLRSHHFTLTADTAFTRVMAACAHARSPLDGVWISPALIQWFAKLHKAGHAHSIEAWRQDPNNGTPHLVGGIYGVSLGSAFFAESMFHRPRPRHPDRSRHPLDGTDASKICLVHLIRHLHRCHYTLLDTQMTTPHVARFGGHEISAKAFERRLILARDQPDRWEPPTFD